MSNKPQPPTNPNSCLPSPAHVFCHLFVISFQRKFHSIALFVVSSGIPGILKVKCLSIIEWIPLCKTKIQEKLQCQKIVLSTTEEVRLIYVQPIQSFDDMLKNSEEQNLDFKES
jgi:hypothetical protein